MTRREGLVLAAAAVVVAGAWAARSGGLLRVSAEADAASGQPGYLGDGTEHLAQPADFGVAGTPMLGAVHPLFRRPDYPGAFRHQVSENGWAWFTDPPADKGL